MKKETKILNIICVAAAVLLVAFAAFNAINSGSFITIDNLFLTAVCLLLALTFAVTPLVSLSAAGKLPWPFKKREPALAGAEDSEIDAPRYAHEEVHFAGTNKLFLFIWLWLIALTLVEIFLGYKPMRVQFMLTILLGLSIIKAALIIAYFMHLKFEKLTLILTLVPMTVICICLLFVFFPDSRRSSDLRYKFNEPQPVPHVEKTDEP
jgi:cytochrome c oxidase subunit IV